MIVRASALHLPLRDACVDLIVTSPPYFALRSYRDGGEHYNGQVGSEETPGAFVDALIEATKEMVRVLKPTGSIFVNLGDKYAGSGGHNNANISKRNLPRQGATRRNAPDRYNQSTEMGRRLDKNGQSYITGGLPKKSLMGLPWRYANAVVDRLGLILRRDLIWHKPNGLPESVTDRCRTSHEYWFHFTKQGQYFAAVDGLREGHDTQPHAPGNNPRGITAEGIRGQAQASKGISGHLAEPDRVWGNPLGRAPGSVWTIPLEPLIIPEAVRAHHDLPDHFAASPQEWPRRLILGWSPARTGVVLDPFGGTGTVAMVARALGRIGISGDLSGDYCRLARWRVYESGHAAKSEDRTWRDAQGAML